LATLFLSVLSAQSLVLAAELGELDARLLTHCGKRDLGPVSTDGIGGDAGDDTSQQTAADSHDRGPDDVAHGVDVGLSPGRLRRLRLGTLNAWLRIDDGWPELVDLARAVRHSSGAPARRTCAR
jgi:hypothetical protein